MSSLCSLGWPGIHDHLPDPPFQVLGLLAWATSTNKPYIKPYIEGLLYTALWLC